MKTSHILVGVAVIAVAAHFYFKSRAASKPAVAQAEDAAVIPPNGGTPSPPRPLLSALTAGDWGTASQLLASAKQPPIGAAVLPRERISTATEVPTFA